MSGGPDYKPSASYIPKPGRTPPNPETVAVLVDKIADAKRPIIIAGRGAVASGAQAAIEALAETSGALLATTLPGRGMFDSSPFSVGVAGGFASEVARELFADSGSGDRDRRQPHLLHCRRWRPVPEGLRRADRRAAAWAARRHAGGRPVREGRREGGRRSGHAGTAAARRQERRATAQPRSRSGSRTRRSIRPSSRSRPAHSIRATSLRSSTA